MKVSLRGSLASQFADQATLGQRRIDDPGPLVIALLLSEDPDIEYRLEGDYIVVGRTSERGQYPPDW